MRRDKVSSTGGARIGWVNATWPFAKLTARQNKLDLNATLIGRYTFSADQVISIDKYVIIPVLGWGIRIHHNIPTYPKKIVFWCVGSPNSLIRKIKETGFLPGADPDSIPPRLGIPVRWQAVVAIAALWNLLLMMDMGLPPKPGSQPGWFSFLAVFLVFTGAVSIWRVPWLQRCVLNPERSPGEIKAWLNLLALVCGFLSIIMLVTLFNSGL